MDIEIGEYFVVKRGIELNNSICSVFTSPFTDSAFNKNNDDKPPRYDRSHEGLIYKALQVCDEHIAAECVFAESYKSSRLGKRISLNTSEIEIWPVTEKYVACFLIQEASPRGN